MLSKGATTIPFDGCDILHGSSNKLIQDVCECVENSDDLKKLKPQRDKLRWKKKKLQTYYVCASSTTEHNVAAMRLVYDTDYLIIDYLFIMPYMRNMGFGTIMVNFARFLALSNIQAPKVLITLSTKESSSFWISKGFLKCKIQDRKRLNPYDDTYLMVLR